jgi:hypothetical protein
MLLLNSMVANVKAKGQLKVQNRGRAALIDIYHLMQKKG